MNNQQMGASFSRRSTPLLADACLHLDIPLRLAPAGIHRLSLDNHIAGRALPVRHYGSVDIFLEAIGTAQPGDILVIDNQGRLDEGCIGDLTVLEAQACGLAGCCANSSNSRNIWPGVQMTIHIRSAGICVPSEERLRSKGSSVLAVIDTQRDIFRNWRY